MVEIMAKARGPKAMTDSHKAALEQGRSESRIVREYLTSVQATKRGPGRWRSEDTLRARLTAVNEELETADAFDQLMLIQERRDLEDELSRVDNERFSEIEASFVAIAKGFSARRGISYATWRDVGVPAATLKAAGITRGDV